jgi:hypothetical protein
LTKIDTCLNCVISSNYPQNVFFFYPTAKVKSSEFEKISNDLKAELSSKEMNKTLVQFIYFKQNLKSDAKGMKLRDANKMDSTNVNYLKCFVKGIDTNFLTRSKNLMPVQFEFHQVFQNDDIYEIEIKDTTVCIEMLNKLRYLNQFISEALSPNYTKNEKIEIIESSIVLFTKEIKRVEQDLIDLNKKVAELMDLVGKLNDE